jgi:HPt (histidine-containing phosphotransfer) domain-containing protein
VTQLEHHSNFVPWHVLCRETGAQFEMVEVDDEAVLQLDQLDALLATGTVKLVAVGHVSNAAGTINPVAEIVRRAHAAGAVVVVDGSQAIPQLPVDVGELDADFYAWTGHKLYGPTGVGILHGRKELLDAMPPFLGGGHMISSVSVEEIRWGQLPAKFEAGTSNIAEAIGLGAAVDFVAQIGAEAIRAHERETGADPVPIIALTASVMQGEPEKCRAAGMDDFAAKPTTIPFLAGRLHRWLPHLDWPAPPAPEAPQPPVPGAVAGEPLDPSVLEELTGGDAQLAAEVLDEFLTTTRADIEALGDACAEHGADDVRRLAHRIRGAARAVGAQPLAEVAQRAESLAALGSADWERFEILRDELAAALDEVSALVRS